MASDPRRLSEAMRHIQLIKNGTYPVVIGQPGDYHIKERLWQDMPERNKLAILQDAVNWEGVTNRDQARVLLTEIDPGKIADKERNRLIDMAIDRGNEADCARDRSKYAVAQGRDNGRER